jgi:hypothetical protein
MNTSLFLCIYQEGIISSGIVLVHSFSEVRLFLGESKFTLYDPSSRLLGAYL